MDKKRLIKLTLTIFALSGLFLLGRFFWNIENQTLEEKLVSLGKVGEIVVEDLGQGAGFAKSEEGFSVSDSRKGFPTIQVAEAKEDEKEQNLEADPRQKDEGKLEITLPSDYSKPLEVKLDGSRKIEITDLSSEKFKTESNGAEKAQDLGNFPQGMIAPGAEFSHYRSSDGRKEIYYAYQTQENSRILKNWILYQKGNGNEEETYHFKSAILRKNEQGEVEVYHFGAADESQGVQVEGVSQDLFTRAQLAIGNDMRDDIEKNGGTPDFVIPKPYFIDAQGERTDLEWKIDQQKNEISVSFSVKKGQYPLALDPTLQFTAPGQPNTRSVIQGEGGGVNAFGTALAVGDFNGDGKEDLAIGAPNYSTNIGRVYIFFGGEPIALNSTTADVIITGEASNNYFGESFAVGDFNSDGKNDLAVGAWGYSANIGRAYIFHNDGSIPTTAAAADVIINGESTTGRFGKSLAAGDFNTDGTIDLAVGAWAYSSAIGRVYIFHNDGSIPTTADTADVIITGETSFYNFGNNLVSGDFNADGRTDLAVAETGYLSGTGRVNIFYNDGTIPTTAATADVRITGEISGSSFGASLVSGDFNADGRTDLVVGASGYSGNIGRVYIFHNDDSIPITADAADIIITGEGSGIFGTSLVTGDFNSDGKIDLAVGAQWYSTNTGRAYIFYNDGSIPTTAATADIIITGETTNNYFGVSLAAGDFNTDGKTDLAVGAYGHSSNNGRVYVFYSNNGILDNNQDIKGVMLENLGQNMVVGDFNHDGKNDLAVGYVDYSGFTGRVYIFYNDGSIPTSAATADIIITGEGVNNYFGGFSMAAGDFNADGKTDLAVGARGYASSTGRVYIFHNDGSIPTAATEADVIITGETTNNLFGYSLAAGDFNDDGTTDLVAGAYMYSSSTGRAYIFHNDGSIPTSAASADVIITGETTSSLFGISFFAGDFNADGKTDLVVGARGYATSTGRVYIFHNDGSIPTTAATADIIITGEATNNIFGSSFSAGDFNADGTTDLVVAARDYATSTGRVYIFHNDGSIPTSAGTADIIITGEATNNYFGYSLDVGDFNSDGTTDLAVGAYNYSSGIGRVYIFHNDGSIPTTAASADVIITGEAGVSYFGTSLAAGDFNSDSTIDLVVGSQGYLSIGRIYVFHNDGSIPADAASADVIITGQMRSVNFGIALVAGDFNADGRTDLAVGSNGYSSSTGRVYVFYNDGSIPIAAAEADVIITGEATNNFFGASLASGDFNSDGRIDLAVGAPVYTSNNTGRVYILHNDGSIPTTAAEADVIITGEATNNFFGVSLAAGDFNSDGKTDLAVGAEGYSTNTGRVYIFHNDGSIPTTAGTADHIITGGSTANYFGISLVAGDFNADGRTDLAVGARGYVTSTGRVYIFHNDGSIPTTAASADVTITGQATNNWFGFSLAAGDFNSDGRIDLAVGARNYSSFTGRVYIFYNDGSIPTTAASADVIITGEATTNYFGWSLFSGDFNADGRTDLVVQSYGYLSSTGRVYIFHNDGSIPTTAASADVIITGEANISYFGSSFAAGDFNSDGTTDLAVGAPGYISSTGRVHFLFTSPGTAVDQPIKFRGNLRSKGTVKIR